MSKWIENYIKGCAKCQQNKALTHRTIPPPYKIDVPPLAQPFEVVAMDLITQLPNSHGHDTILTIVDHGCTRAALFLPCTTNITGEGIAKLYLDNVYQWFGIPSKIISDRDPRFTLHFSTSLCQHLGIDRNISTNSIRKENQSQTLLLQHAAYHQIKGFFDFPCLKVDSESLILNTY